MAKIAVSPASSLADQPVRIRVSGLSPKERVSVEVRSVDATGIDWASSTDFKADSRGRLDFARATALGGRYPTYRGVWGMGAIALMQPTKPSRAVAYIWSGVRRFTVSAHAGGHTLASAVFHRTLSARGLRVEHATLAGYGFIGDYYWAPRSVSGRRPAIVAFGGSEGGESTTLLAALLAAHGYPTLALAYFKEPGLPKTLSDIPLEYFAKALRWLERQPQVDPRRILTLGISRGSEAALLLGVHYPTLVHGVIASVPANVAVCSFPGCAGAAWTFEGKPLPFTRQFDQPHPTDDRAAVIPVERIRGPIFLDCGGADAVWSSCAYATAIVRRLDAHHAPYRHVLKRFPRAGHHVGGFVPDEPSLIDTSAADGHAREALWPRLLAFLASV